jgi:formate/nitrite transporter FocA (FNT family)
MRTAAAERRAAAPSRDGGRQEEGQERQKEREQAEADERRSVNARTVHQAILMEGEEELQRTSAALAWSGLAAGISMGLSLAVEGILRAHLPDAPWRPLVTKFGYTIGFLVVILGRQQLFTENTLTPVLPWLQRRCTLANVLRLWSVVLAANLVGALLFALAAYSTGAFPPDARAAFAEIARDALGGGGFGAVLARAVPAGWIIALVVWVLPGAESGRVAAIFLLTYVIGLGGFAHIVAGAAEVFYGALAGVVTWPAAVGGYLVPTLLGNVLGGAILVTLLNHAQVVADEKD